MTFLALALGRKFFSKTACLYSFSEFTLPFEPYIFATNKFRAFVLEVFSFLVVNSLNAFCAFRTGNGCGVYSFQLFQWPSCWERPSSASAAWASFQRFIRHDSPTSLRHDTQCCRKCVMTQALIFAGKYWLDWVFTLFLSYNSTTCGILKAMFFALMERTVGTIWWWYFVCSFHVN